MTDKDLLELAAKAAGITPLCVTDRGVATERNGSVLINWWNPLTNDGDALRLAVKLVMSVVSGTYKVVCEFIPQEDDESIITHSEQYGDDPCAATRRAITRAAAEIGKQMIEAAK